MEKINHKNHSNPRRRAGRNKKAAQENRTTDTRHRRPQRGAEGKRKQEQSFSSHVSCAVLGTAPLFYTPAVFRPWGRHSGVADCPLASADTSGPVTQVLELLEIVDELVGTVECPFLVAGSLDRWIAGSTGRGVDTVAGGCVD